MFELISYARNLLFSKIGSVEKYLPTRNSKLMTIPVATGMETNPECYIREGYNINATIFRCINLLATSVAKIPVIVMDGDEEIENHPALEFIKKPNLMQTREEFVEGGVAFYSLLGNSYTYRTVSGNNEPLEAYNLNPVHMRVGARNDSPLPAGYIFQGPVGEPIHFDFNDITGECDILHIKSFNPSTVQHAHLVGMSPVSACAINVDQENSANKWNFSLLENSASPSGILSTEEALSEDQYLELKKQAVDKFQGKLNAGQVPILHSGLAWQALTMSPKDMEWLEGKNVNSRDICKAFDTPPQLVFIKGDSTYANNEQADLSYHENKVIPVARKYWAAMTKWLQQSFPGTWRFELKLDEVPALAPRREILWQRAQNNSFMTTDEKRKMVGLPNSEQDNADVVLVPAGLIPLEQVGLEPTPPDTSDFDDEENEDEQEE